MAQPNYPPPTVLCSTTGTGLQPQILDIGPFMATGYPPVIQIVISATATVEILGSVAISASPPTGALVNGIDMSSGGYTASDFIDLIPGVRFYQVNVVANTGTVTVLCGSCPSGDGGLATPDLIRISTNATQGM